MIPTDLDEQPITIDELAVMLRVSVDTAYAMARRGPVLGGVPGWRAGRLWRFYPSAVREHLSAPSDPWQRSTHSAARRRAA